MKQKFNRYEKPGNVAASPGRSQHRIILKLFSTNIKTSQMYGK